MEIISSLPKDDVVEKEVSAEETSPGKEVETEQQAIDEVDKNRKKENHCFLFANAWKKKKHVRFARKVISAKSIGKK